MSVRISIHNLRSQTYLSCTLSVLLDLVCLNVQGPVSAYFTVFAGSYLPVHVAKIEKADGVYERNAGTHFLKVLTII